MAKIMNILYTISSSPRKTKTITPSQELTDTTHKREREKKPKNTTHEQENKNQKQEHTTKKAIEIETSSH